VQGPNYDAVQALVEVTRDGSRSPLHPRSASTACRHADDRSRDRPRLTRDLYVSLGEPVDGGAWIVRVYCKPFVDWIWGGCLLMALAARSPRATAATARKQTQEATTPITGALATGGDDMKRWHLLAPLVLFVLLAAFPLARAAAGPARSALAAGRQAGAGVLADAARRRVAHDPPRRHARQGVDAQRLGLVVRGPAAPSIRRS
jgi:hypothetical protein